MSKQLHHGEHGVILFFKKKPPCAPWCKLLARFRGSLGGFALLLGEGAAAEGLEFLRGLLDLEQVADLGDHAPDVLGVGEDALPAYLGEAQAAHGGAVVLGVAAEAADELHSQ